MINIKNITGYSTRIYPVTINIYCPKSPEVIN